MSPYMMAGSDCPFCNTVLEYNERYDSVFCPNCRKWLEKWCGEPGCVICEKRPKKPPKMKKKKSATKRTTCQSSLDSSLTCEACSFDDWVKKVVREEMERLVLLLNGINAIDSPVVCKEVHDKVTPIFEELLKVKIDYEESKAQSLGKK